MAKNGATKRGKGNKGSNGAGKMKTGPVFDEDGYEILGGQGGKMQVGEVVEGVFGGIVRTIPSIQKGKPAVPLYQIGARVLLGASVLKNRIEEGGVDVGDTLKVTRLEDGVAKKGQNAPQLFDVRVKRAH